MLLRLTEPRSENGKIFKMTIMTNDPASASTSARPSYNLTRRELQVLRLLAEGFSSQQIADRLGVKFYTATTHLKTIYKKLGVHKRSTAAVLALSQGLVEVYPSDPMTYCLPVLKVRTRLPKPRVLRSPTRGQR